MRISDWSSDVCSSDLRILRYRLSQQEAGEKTVFHAVGHPPAGRVHGRSDTFVANLVRGHVTGAEVAEEAPVIVAGLKLESGDYLFVQIAEHQVGIPLDRKSTRMNSST